MSDSKRMVGGFNHNVKHRGRVFHVQTEDSGLQNPHIITHLFVGGNILASKKTSYADIAGAENLPQVVRELMEEQHKEMLRNLVNGVYDDIGAAAEERAQHYQPGELGGGVAVEADVAAGPAGPGASGPGARAEAPRGGPAPAPKAGWAPPAPAWPEGSEHGVAEDLISDRTLDEVILSYLAEDLGEKK
ncbi:MAG TPA: hypothetical protein VH880_06940 [Anaeromyxobacteraceae bacterium]|jgi:hypothetical protein